MESKIVQFPATFLSWIEQNVLVSPSKTKDNLVFSVCGNGVNEIPESTDELADEMK